MALYAIGDFHLSIVSAQAKGILRRRKHYQLYKPMEVFDPVWKNHADKLDAQFHRLVRPTDTVIITGDLSWGNDLETCSKDLAFIEALPGRKILLRGNHDLFWDARKTNKLNERFAGRLSFLQGNFYSYGDYALVGTKGISYERNRMDHDCYLYILGRELQRLKASYEAAYDAGFRKFLCFLHYPPTSIGEMESPFIDLAREYGTEQVIYSHLHGAKRYGESLQGDVGGIRYRLVSSDYLFFVPEKILP